MTDVKDLYDAVIIGGGPAGLTAALYLARARYRVLVVEKDHFGGQITITNEVVNYPGVFSTSGSELSETMRKQAEAFGAEFLLAEVTKLDMSGDVKVVHTTKANVPASPFFSPQELIHVILALWEKRITRATALRTALPATASSSRARKSLSLAEALQLRKKAYF